MILFTENEFHSLQTARLRLRRPRRSDAADIFRFCSDPDCSRYADWYPHANLGDSRAYIAWLNQQNRKHKDKVCTWFAQRKETNTVIGTVSVVDTDYSGRIATVGYTFSGEYRHQGYATEAVNALLSYLFAERNIARVQAKVMPDNLPSIRLLERIGMRQEGLLLKGAFCKTDCVDVYLYAITRAAWERRASQKESTDTRPTPLSV